MDGLYGDKPPDFENGCPSCQRKQLFELRAWVYCVGCGQRFHRLTGKAEKIEDKGIECASCGCRHFKTMQTRSDRLGRIRRMKRCRNCGRQIRTLETA